MGDTEERDKILGPIYTIVGLLYMGLWLLSYIMTRHKNANVVNEFNEAMQSKGIWAKISYVTRTYYDHPAGQGGSSRRGHESVYLSINSKRI